MDTGTRARSAGARDMAALAVAVILSLLLYAPHLGFYSDDWAFLGRYATSADQTIGGLYAASASPQHAMRPLQLWLCAALYHLFRMNPLGYHLFNAVLLVLNPLLCYAIGRELRVSRTIVLPVALLYAVLPNYSTVRLWYVAFAITFSMTACLASILADLKAAGASVAAGMRWKAVAAIGLIASGLSYEVALPVFIVVPALMVWRAIQVDGRLSRFRAQYLAGLVAINVLLLSVIASFKLQTTVRLGAEQGVLRQVAAIVRDALRPDVPAESYGLNLFLAMRVHFGEYGLLLVSNAVDLTSQAAPALRWLSVLFALASFAYLTWTIRQQPWPSARQWLTLVFAGIVTFGLGYAIFLTNYNVQFTPTGIANRSAIAAALGAAMCLVGILGALATPLSQGRVGRWVFAGAIAAAASSSVLIVNVIAAQWIAAYTVEQGVLAGVRRHFPTLAPRSTVILDGVCPYVGPAIVFESNWDLAGALQTIYRDETLTADVVTPRLAVEDDGIMTTIYQQPTRYPYGNSLFVYHAGSGTVTTLPDAASARTYFRAPTGAPACPRAHEGIGVPLF